MHRWRENRFGSFKVNFKAISILVYIQFVHGFILYSRHHTPPQLRAKRVGINGSKELFVAIDVAGKKSKESNYFGRNCEEIILRSNHRCLNRLMAVYFITASFTSTDPFYDEGSFFSALLFMDCFFFAEKAINVCKFLRLYGFEASFYTNHPQQHFQLTHQVTFFCCRQLSGLDVNDEFSFSLWNEIYFVQAWKCFV